MKKRLIFAGLYFIFCAAVFFLALFIIKANDACYIAAEYTVAEGDTYELLAEYFEIEEDSRDWRERVKLLNGRADSTLYSGETIYVYIKGGDECD